MDPDLVVRAQHGDMAAFEAITIASHPRFFRIAQGILRDPAAAEDATQQAFITIWRYLRKLRDPAKFDGWAYRLLVNACRDEAARSRRWATESGLESASEPAGPGGYGDVLDRDQLERGFRRLSVEHRAVIVMRYLLDLPVDATAAGLGIPPGTVASRLNRAMKALRAALEADARLGAHGSLEEEHAR